MSGTMRIDGQRVEFDKEKNILEVTRKAGIDLPTFCYHSELSIYGACRMCMVEDGGGHTMASCSTPPKDGMEIFTNTIRLQKYRRMILELILSNHDRDCTTCEKSGRCKLQELAVRFGIRQVRFGSEEKDLPIDTSSCSIVRNPNKCILCGDCVRVCEEVQGVGVLGFAHRGSDIRVTPAFNKNLGSVNCINCGQCRTVCPTGALIIKNDNDRLWELLNDSKRNVVAQVAPAVRVALGEEFGMKPGEITMGKIAAALRKIGFNQVYDTALAADLTVVEESAELLSRLSEKKNLPLFTSCCPGWVKYAENRHPELAENISSCRSPMEMFGPVIREYFRQNGDGRETCVVAVMPCTAKKYEITRPEFSTDGRRDVELVITTQELAMLIKECGIDFANLEDEALDMPFGLSSGAGVLFGVTGGVSEAVLRYASSNKSASYIKELAFRGVRGMEGVREAEAEVDGRTVRVAVVHGIKNTENLLQSIRSGEKQYDFVEVMACPGGCIGGAGQPLPQSDDVRRLRAKGIYHVDNASQIKRADDNPAVTGIYENILKGSGSMLHKHH